MAQLPREHEQAPSTRASVRRVRCFSLTAVVLLLGSGFIGLIPIAVAAPGTPGSPSPGSSDPNNPAAITSTQRFTWTAASGSVARYRMNFRDMTTDSVTSYDAGNNLF